MSLQFGAYQAVKCIALQPQERTVIITDKNTKTIADAIYEECEKISKGNTKIFIMEDFGPRPSQFQQQIGQAILESDVSFYIAEGRKGELNSFRVPLIQHIKRNTNLRHAHMVHITEQIMKEGMAVDYDKVYNMSHKIFNIVKIAKQIQVTTPAGTNFIAHFNPNYNWLNSDGKITTSKWQNLPSGEVYTCVDRIYEGIIVIDGCLGDYFRKYGLLEHPITLHIKDTRITNIECEDEILLQELQEYISQDENANRIGEFAIGTNIGLKKLSGNLLQDEKFPGIHIAMGHGYPTETGAPWTSKAHCDAVLKDCTIIVDGEMIMKDGEFLVL